MIEVRKAHELDIAELTEDLPEYGLRQGAQGTVVEVFDKPEEAYMIEFLENSGEVSKLADWVKPEQIKNIDVIAKEAYTRGMEALSEGKFVEALGNIRKAVKLIPSYIGGMHNSLALSIGPHEDWQRFIFAMRLVRLIDPAYTVAIDNLAIGYLNYGVQEAKTGKYRDSVQIFHAALAIEAAHEIIVLVKENIAASYTALGIKDFYDGNVEGALVYFRSARFFSSNEIIKQNFGKAHFHYGNFCSAVGNLKMAIDSYERAEDAGLLLPEVLNNHACALASNGQLMEARMIFETAQALAPDNLTITFNLSKVPKIDAGSALNVEAVVQDFITEEVEVSFRSLPMNTIPLRMAA
jgi:tetratricopeptide (TPR) repeat protein